MLMRCTIILHLSLIGILMDILILDYHWEKFNSSGLQLLRKKDIENSASVYGMTFSSHAWQQWEKYLNHFFRQNKDAESRLLTDAASTLQKKVGLKYVQFSNFWSGFSRKARPMANAMKTPLDSCLGTDLVQVFSGE